MMILVTGGSGSGKSSFAEDCIVSFGNARRIYIATMYPFDEESKKRVKRHQAMRQGKGFDTLECYTGLVRAAIPEGSTVLLECMSNLVANEMFQENGAHENTVEAVIGGVDRLNRQLNKVKSQEYLGKINQKLADMADEVVEVVYGIPVYHKKYTFSDTNRREVH